MQQEKCDIILQSLRPGDAYAFLKWVIIGSVHGLSPVQCKAITWTNADFCSTGPLGTKFSGILIEIQTFSLKKMLLKRSSVKCRLSCRDLNVLIACKQITSHLKYHAHGSRFVGYHYDDVTVTGLRGKSPCFAIHDQLWQHGIAWSGVIHLPWCQWSDPREYWWMKHVIPSRINCTTTIKQSKTKPCARYTEYTIHRSSWVFTWPFPHR